MVECPNCQTQYDGPVAFCGACGTRLTDSEGGAPAAPADPLIGIVVDGRYRIIDLIGRGGMGAVYRVEHVKMGKVMAMKLLHGELSSDRDISRRFRREAETVSRLSHINNVSVFDFGSHQGMMYLVMEYIHGRDLSDVLRAEGPLPALRVASILVQVCSGLIDAHSKGIVHRDLKPENILVTQDHDQADFVKVLDFGLAKLRDPGRGTTKITQQGSLVGTPYYMAPEHIRGDKVDARSDIYALGAVMYKLLSGETPFSASTPMGIITKHLTEVPEPPSRRFPLLGIPPEADAIVLKAMAKDPAQRYVSAEEMRAALGELAAKIDPESIAGRFTSHGDGAGTASRAVAAPDGATPVRTSFQPTAAADAVQPRQTRSPTVTIGAREVSISTKSDFIHFETGLRRRRILQAVLVALFATGALAIGAYFIVLGTRDDSVPTVETEPNDVPAEADTMVANIQLAGMIVASSPDHPDIDWYRLRGPEVPAGQPPTPWGVAVEVSGVPGLDLALQLVDPELAEPLAVTDRGHQGEGELVPALRVEKRDVYLMVQEVRKPGVPPGNFPGAAYGVTYRIYDPAFLEREPNDHPGSATPAHVGTGINGVLRKVGDVDWYCLPANESASLVQVTAVPNVRVELNLRLGPTGRLVVPDALPIGAGARATIEPGPGPICAAVAATMRATEVAGTAVGKTPEEPYQILFQ